MTWNVNRPTRRYLDELARDPAGARAVQDLVRVSPLPFLHSGRLLTRPLFLERPELRRLEVDLLGIYDLLVSLPERLFDGDLERYGVAVGFDPAQTRLALRTAASQWPPPPVARADLYRDGGGFKLLELNLSSALGGFQVADLNRLLLQSDLMRAFTERERLGYVDPMPLLAEMLRRRHPDPVVALVDWPDAFPTWEPMLRAMADQFAELDIDARPCHVGQLRADAGGLALDGVRVGVVFRYFNLAQVTADADAMALFEPVASACERGLAQMFIPLTGALLATKKALGLLSEERHRDAFSSAELDLIDRVLPWTRELRDGPVHMNATVVDLRDLCLSARESLILKPGYLSGGQGVVPGWTVGEREWRTALEEMWNGSFVVQRRIVPVPEPFPHVDTEELEPWLVLWGTFFTGRAYAGTWFRCSRNLDDGVVNLGSGSSLGTCFHSEDE